MRDKNKSNLSEINFFNSAKIQTRPNVNIHGVGTTTYKAENEIKEIFSAIQNKLVVHDFENDRVLAFSDDYVYEVGEEVKEIIISYVIKSYEAFKEEIKEKGFNANDIKDILELLEAVNASYITSPELIRIRREISANLIRMSKNSSDVDRIIKEGIADFFNKSKESINYKRVKFERLPYTIENGKEKEVYRLDYISELVNDGLIDYEFLLINGIITESKPFIDNDGNKFVPIDYIFRKKGIFSNDELQNALIISDSFENRDEILDYYRSKDRKFYFSFATSDEIARDIISKKIDAKDAVKAFGIERVKDINTDLLEQLLTVQTFPKNTEFIKFVQEKGKNEKFLQPKLLYSIDREKFMRLVFSNKIKYKNPLQSNDYIENYGKLTSDDIMLLYENGFINPEDIIKLTKFTSMKVQDEEEYNKMIAHELSFYDINTLEKLLNEDKLNERFVELFNNLINANLTKEQREQYFKNMSEDMQDKENAEQKVILLIKKGLNVEEVLGHQLSFDDLSDMYIDGKINEDDIIKLYEKGLINPQLLREFFKEEELIENYKNGKVSYKVLDFIENREKIIKEELIQGNIGIREVIESYASETGISIKEFEHIIENYDISEINISELLPDEISAEKVEELFRGYYISHDDLSDLVERNIITNEQKEEFATKMANHEQYESMFDGKSGVVILVRESTSGKVKENSESGEHKEVNKRASQVKNDPLLQEELLDKIGVDDRVLMLKGNGNSLDGYTIYPSEEFGIMILLNNTEPQNATYILSLQQGLYLLNKAKRTQNIMQQKSDVPMESTATKSVLRETEHVKVRNASKGWGKNIVDSIRALSPVFKEKIKTHDDYRERIEKIIDEIRTDYDLRRE